MKTMEEQLNDKIKEKDEIILKLQADLDYIAVMTGVDPSV